MGSKMSTMVNLENQEFGRLTVVKKSNKRQGGHVVWECACSCGNKVLVSSDNLRSGNTKSCGCFNKEKSIEDNTSHGGTYNPLFKIYSNFHQRCYNQKIHKYKDYGGRGITVEWEWHIDNPSGWENFLNWCKKNPKPSGVLSNRSRYSLDRIDNNGNYSPDNCRWATAAEQVRNRRVNVPLTYKGDTKLIEDWTRILGCGHSSIAYHLKKGKPFPWIFENFSSKNPVVF